MDYRELKELLERKRAEYLVLQARLGALRAAKYPESFRPKQLPPDHPEHHKPDAQGFSCGCAGIDDDFVIWLLMSGRGFGKSLVGSTWLVRQALKFPASEWAVFAPTFRDTRKVCIEGSTGLLAALGEDELASYRRNELQITLKNGSVIYGYSADQPERARGANLWGAWCDELGCLPGYTLVSTSTGPVRIDAVEAGDWVHTRSGLRRVLWAGATRRDAELWELAISDGRCLLSTPDHQVWTIEHGWTEAQNIQPGDTLLSWRDPGSNGTDAAGTATSETVTTATGSVSYCTGSSGNTPTARSLTAESSTTSTMTRTTTSSATCDCYPTSLLTCESTPRSGSTRTGSPTAPRKQRSNEQTGSGATVSLGKSPASNAAPCSCRQACVASSVLPPVSNVSYVAVVSSKRVPGREPVTYDLTVEGDPEFFADGLLVHNSWRYEATWHEGLVPALRKGEKPRIVVTTTPRPTKLIRDLVGRHDGSVHITTGSTWENALNLSATALAELKHRYEGSRLGRQELEGELLEDIEGALWSRSVIDANRVGKDQVPQLTRVVVAIDPAVTSGEESDESGIVVVGHSGDHGYVLGDYSFRGTPNEVMRRALWVYREFRADCIVAEVNNGGDYIGNALRTVDTNVPYKTVHASRGKAIRAEPISALYEQGRMHHVGLLAELEDQLCSFVPGVGASPDRLDALVWAATELHGLTEGSWLSAYGAVVCRECGHSYLPGLHPKCPKCGVEN